MLMFSLLITALSPFLDLHSTSVWLLLLTDVLEKPEESASHRCHETLCVTSVLALSRRSGREVRRRPLSEWVTLKKTQAVNIKLYTTGIIFVQIWFLALQFTIAKKKHYAHCKMRRVCHVSLQHHPATQKNIKGSVRCAMIKHSIMQA